jgi:hypothetical protein
MKKAGVLLLFVLLLAAISSIIVAQDATAEPTAEPTSELTAEATLSANHSDQNAQQGIVTRVRFANLSPDAPVFVVYADGQPTNVQLLEYPAISGWVEFAGSPTFALVPRGGAQSQALLGGTFTLDNTSGDWTTIAIVGSQNDGSLSAVSFNEDVANIPAGCARVTVFHSIEGGPSVDIKDDQGNTWVSGLGFPGGSASGSVTSNAPGCTNQSAEATAEAGTTGSQGAEASTTGNQAGTMNGTGALQCVALVMTGSQGNNQTGEATAEASMAGSQGAEATAEATSAASMTTDMQGSGTFTGSRFGNCGYTFDVPAGTVNFQVVPSGTTGNALLDMSNTSLSADTYYFIAAVGSPEAPQTFVWSFSGAPVPPLLTNQQANAPSHATPEAAMETTPEATPGT